MSRRLPTARTSTVAGTILHDFAAWVLPKLPDAASSRLRVGGGSVSRSRASDILDCDVPGLVFLPGPNFDLDVTAERGQKAHQPFEGNFGEFSSEDFRQLGLNGPNPPRGSALRQPERIDCFVQPEDELSL